MRPASSLAVAALVAATVLAGCLGGAPEGAGSLDRSNTTTRVVRGPPNGTAVWVRNATTVTLEDERCLEAAGQRTATPGVRVQALAEERHVPVKLHANLTWDASQPLAETLEVELVSTGHAVAGGSPLHGLFELPNGSEGQRSFELRIRCHADPAGYFADVPVEVEMAMLFHLVRPGG